MAASIMEAAVFVLWEKPEHLNCKRNVNGLDKREKCGTIILAL